MESSNPKLKFHLAKNALLHFYHNRYWTPEELAFLRDFFSANDSDRAWKLKMRLLCKENNDMIVSAVVADASEEERIFLDSRYRLNLSFVEIGMDLNIHPNGLQRWRDKFLADIAALLEYRLPTADIFSRNKVEALIYALERVIALHEGYGKADKAALDSLKAKLNSYQDLLFVLKQFLSSDSEKIGRRIIKLKILNQNMPLEELERHVRSSHTTIDGYIRRFHKQFYPQILAKHVNSQ